MIFAFKSEASDDVDSSTWYCASLFFPIIFNSPFLQAWIPLEASVYFVKNISRVSCISPPVTQLSLEFTWLIFCQSASCKAPSLNKASYSCTPASANPWITDKNMKAPVVFIFHTMHRLLTAVGLNYSFRFNAVFIGWLWFFVWTIKDLAHPFIRQLLILLCSM